MDFGDRNSLVFCMQHDVGGKEVPATKVWELRSGGVTRGSVNIKTKLPVENGYFALSYGAMAVYPVVLHAAVNAWWNGGAARTHSLPCA